MENHVNHSNTMAVTSMIVGILSLFLFIAPPVQFIFGMVAILFAIFSKKEKPFSGFAIAGFVIAALSLFISVALVWFSYQLLQNPAYAPLLDLMDQVYSDMYGGLPAK